jgi:hypothetical protein
LKKILEICLRNEKLQVQAATRAQGARAKRRQGKHEAAGVASIGDKLAQGAMADVLNPSCEPMFYDFSFGFRKGKSQQALCYT